VVSWDKQNQPNEFSKNLHSILPSITKIKQQNLLKLHQTNTHSAPSKNLNKTSQTKHTIGHSHQKFAKNNTNQLQISSPFGHSPRKIYEKREIKPISLPFILWIWVSERERERIKALLFCAQTLSKRERES
jgi:hypothetical protein